MSSRLFRTKSFLCSEKPDILEKEGTVRPSVCVLGVHVREGERGGGWVRNQ